MPPRCAPMPPLSPAARVLRLIGASLSASSVTDRGVETPAFRPGRKRRFTSPVMSVLSDSVFACPGTGCATPAQQAVLRDHCGHARSVWNLAVEQHAHWRPGRKGAPGYREQCRQLTQARAEHPWLAAGTQTVQQQALRDFARAMAAFLDPAQPGRAAVVAKAGQDEGFRIVGARAAVGRAPGVPQGRPGLGAEGRLGAVPLVPPGAAGREVLPGDDGPGRPVACRLRRDPRAGPGTR